MHDPLDWIDDELLQIDSAHLLRRGVMRHGSQSTQVVIDGRTYINFSSNDYLGLAADPRLSSAVTQSLEDGGWGSGASPLVTGRGPAPANPTAPADAARVVATADGKPKDTRNRKNSAKREAATGEQIDTECRHLHRHVKLS